MRKKAVHPIEKLYDVTYNPVYINRDFLGILAEKLITKVKKVKQYTESFVEKIADEISYEIDMPKSFDKEWCLDDILWTVSAPCSSSGLYSKIETLDNILEILKKQDKTRRPKTRKTLSSSMETLFQGQVSKEDTDLIVEQLFRERFIEEKNKRIAYLD